MVLIDTHTHLYLPQFHDDIEQVFLNARKSHVIKTLLPNIDCESIEPMLSLCSRFPLHCHPMLGLHPTSVKDDYNEKLIFMESIFNSKKFIAIGETGMDAHWDTSFLNHQEDSFIRHLEWAKKLDLPVVIHSRQTMDNILSIIRSSFKGKVRGVFHAFSGTVRQSMEVIEMGFKLGIGGVVTYKNSRLAEVIQAVDLNHIVLETDSPYLTPVPHRGKRNESANLIYVAEKIAEIKNLTIENVAEATSNNAFELFNLKPH